MKRPALHVVKSLSRSWGLRLTRVYEDEYIWLTMLNNFVVCGAPDYGYTQFGLS